MQQQTVHTNQKESVSISFIEEGTTLSTPPTSASLRVRQRDGVIVLLNISATVGARTAEAIIAPNALPPGIYRAWLHLVLPDTTERDTKEIELLSLEHAPGEGVRTGRVYRLARLKVPVAWDALQNYPDFGDVGLMTLVNLVERRAVGYAMTLNEEDSVDLLVANYLAHMAALEAIPSAVDFWTNQVVAQTARGPGEVHTFPDRIRANEEQLKRMLAQVDDLRAEAQGALGLPVGPQSEAMSLLDGGLPITPDIEKLRHSYDGPLYAGYPFEEIG